MARKLVLVLVAALALAVAGVALGGGTLKISADKTNKLAFDKKSLKTTAGMVTIVMANPAILKHNVAIRAGTTAKSKLIAKGKVVGKGGVSRVTAVLKKGKYRFLCTVPGHEAAGMWGILTVT